MIPSFLLNEESKKRNPVKGDGKLFFIDKTMKNMASFIFSSQQQWNMTQRNGLLQKLDARVKVIFMLTFIILTGLVPNMALQIFIFCLIFFLIVISRVDFVYIYKRVLFLGFFFGFIIFLPASLNLFTKGEVVYRLVQFQQAYHWWIYSIPSEISITDNGIMVVLRMSMKVINSVSIALLIMSTTSFEQVAKALSVLKVPGIFLLTLSLCYKFIFILARTTEETYMAMKMRWWSRGAMSNAENVVAGRVGFLFRRAWEKYEQTYLSMIARGFDGKVNMSYIGTITKIDVIFALAMGIIFFVVLIIFLFYA